MPSSGFVMTLFCFLRVGAGRRSTGPVVTGGSDRVRRGEQGNGQIAFACGRDDHDGPGQIAERSGDLQQGLQRPDPAGTRLARGPTAAATAAETGESSSTAITWCASPGRRPSAVSAESIRSRARSAPRGAAATSGGRKKLRPGSGRSRPRPLQHPRRGLHDQGDGPPLGSGGAGVPGGQRLLGGPGQQPGRPPRREGPGPGLQRLQARHPRGGQREVEGAEQVLGGQPAAEEVDGEVRRGGRAERVGASAITVRSIDSCSATAALLVPTIAPRRCSSARSESGRVSPASARALLAAARKYWVAVGRYL